MPPGATAINAWRGDGPVSLAVNVNAEGATNAQKSFDMIMEAVKAGEEDRPYIDLNHNDEEAAGWPSAFVWGGDDPIKGGIRMQLEWSAAGKAAILGKNFRRFSPTFYVDENGIVIGAPVNMGGLVNRAAFKRIAPIWSKSASAVEDPAQQPTEENEPTMKSLLAVLAKLGLTSSAEIDEATAVTQVTAKFTEITAGATKSSADLVTAKADLETANKELVKAKKAHATSVVDAAIAAGRIPGQDDTVKAKWVGLIEADPTNASLLPEPTEALKQVVASTQAKDAQGKTRIAGGAQHPFMAKVSEYQADHKCSEAFAIEAVAHTKEGNDLYNDYRTQTYGVKQS